MFVRAIEARERLNRTRIDMSFFFLNVRQLQMDGTRIDAVSVGK